MRSQKTVNLKVIFTRTFQQSRRAPHYFSEELRHHVHHSPRQPLPDDPTNAQPGLPGPRPPGPLRLRPAYLPDHSPPDHLKVIQPESAAGAQRGALCYEEL